MEVRTGLRLVSVWDEPIRVTVEVGETQGSYRVVVAPGDVLLFHAFSDENLLDKIGKLLRRRDGLPSAR